MFRYFVFDLTCCCKAICDIEIIRTGYHSNRNCVMSNSHIFHTPPHCPKSVACKAGLYKATVLEETVIPNPFSPMVEAVSFNSMPPRRRRDGTPSPAYAYPLCVGGDGGNDKGKEGSSHIVPIAGGCGAGVLILLIAVFVVVKVKKRPWKSEISSGGERRTSEDEFEEHVNVFYGRTGDTSQAGAAPRRNASPHDNSDQTAMHDNEYVRIDSDALPIQRATVVHENFAASRSRHKENPPLDISDHGDVYSVVDKARCQNAAAEDSRGNENVSSDRRKFRKGSAPELADPAGEYAFLDRTRSKNAPPPMTVVDAEVYASVDKTKNLRSPAAAPGARKGKEKTLDILHENGLEGACAAAADDEIVMIDNPCFWEGDYDVDPSGDIYINLDERVKFTTHGSDSDRQPTTDPDTPRLHPTGSRKASRKKAEPRPD